MKTVIVDYGMGNLRSVAKACEKVGFSPLVTSDPKAVVQSSSLILPGVGAFQECVKNLKSRGLFEPVLEILQKNDRPFLGICLGLQLLFEESEEAEGSKGFGIIKGRVKKFIHQHKVPHMGWNQIQIKKKDSPLFEGIEEESYFYFVHSYYVAPSDKEVIATTTDYEEDFVSSIQIGNIFGTQFHPEKSQEQGLQVLKNFAKFCKKRSLTADR